MEHDSVVADSRLQILFTILCLYKSNTRLHADGYIKKRKVLKNRCTSDMVSVFTLLLPRIQTVNIDILDTVSHLLLLSEHGIFTKSFSLHLNSTLE